MGCVYILVNEAMPGLVKIGQTSRTAEERAGELLPPTGVPCPFEVACALYCEQYKKLETDIHKKLNAYRVNTKKEFFRYPVNDAIRVLKQLYSGYLNAEILSLDSRKTKLIERIEKAEESEQALLVRGQAARQETEYLESEVARLESEVTKAHQKIEVLRNESGKTEKELLRREQDKRRKIESLKSEVEQLKAEKKKMQKEIGNLKDQKKYKNAVGQKVRIFSQEDNMHSKDKSGQLRSKKGKDPGYRNAVGRREKIYVS